jgi:hypothetical protein
MLLFFVGCSVKGHIFEVYQNGVKVDEVCRANKESFQRRGSYYKITEKKCVYNMCSCSEEKKKFKEELKKESNQEDFPAKDIEEDFK